MDMYYILLSVIIRKYFVKYLFTFENCFVYYLFVGFYVFKQLMYSNDGYSDGSFLLALFTATSPA